MWLWQPRTRPSSNSLTVSAFRRARPLRDVLDRWLRHAKGLLRAVLLNQVRVLRVPPHAHAVGVVPELRFPLQRQLRPRG